MQLNHASDLNTTRRHQVVGERRIRMRTMTVAVLAGKTRKDGTVDYKAELVKSGKATDIQRRQGHRAQQAAR